jgi:hypothetical protein
MCELLDNWWDPANHRNRKRHKGSAAVVVEVIAADRSAHKRHCADDYEYRDGKRAPDMTLDGK